MVAGHALATHLTAVSSVTMTSKAMSSGNSERLASLTGVRAIAASAVFLSHVAAPSFLPDRLRTFMGSGYSGVTLFFVLSGFVLAWAYADRLTPLRPRPLLSFAVARIARIYPLYLFALLLATIPVLVSGSIPSSIWYHVLAVQTWHSNCSIAMSMNGPGWSIGVEFFLYACFPLLIVTIMKIKKSRSGLLAIAIACCAAIAGLALWFLMTGWADLSPADPSSAHRWLYRTPVTRLGDFMVGITAALLIRRYRAGDSCASNSAQKSLALVAQVTGMTGYASLMAWPAMGRSVWSWDAAYLVPTFLLLWGLAAGPGTVFARVLSSRPMVRAGEASFAFYLLHATLLPRLAVQGVDTWRGWVAVTVLQYVTIMLISLGANAAIESPAQRWIMRTFSPGSRQHGVPPQRHHVDDPSPTLAAR